MCWQVAERMRMIDEWNEWEKKHSLLSDETLAKIYDDAADYIIKHKWTQRTNVDAHGKVCARGALLQVTTYRMRMQFYRDERRLHETLIALIPGRPYDVIFPDAIGALVAYNDAPERTAEDIITLFRNAAIKLRGDECRVSSHR